MSDGSGVVVWLFGCVVVCHLVDVDHVQAKMSRPVRITLWFSTKRSAYHAFNIGCSHTNARDISPDDDPVRCMTFRRSLQLPECRA